MNLSEFRQQQNSAYENLSDGELAAKLYDRFYKGTISLDDFANKIELPNSSISEFKQYVDQNNVDAGSYVSAALRGATGGIAENIQAAGQAAIEKITGGDRTYNEAYQDYLRKERQQIENLPAGHALASELVGGLATGSTILKGGRYVASKIADLAPNVLGRVAQNPVVQSSIGAGAFGGIYGTATGEGTAQERLEQGGDLVIPSALFGAGGTIALNIGANIAPKIRAAFMASSRNPSIDSLKRVKDTSYQAADEAGIVFSGNDMSALNQRISQIARDGDFVPEADIQTAAVIKILSNYKDTPITLGQLDKLRQRVWARYNQTTDITGQGGEGIIRDIIDEIDNTINTSGPASSLMTVARESHNRYKKAQLIDRAWNLAEESASASGTGGNTVNRYRQTILKILNGRDARYFNEEEITAMRKFVSGDMTDNILRSVGRLDPTSGGLMMALNVGAAVADPRLLGLGLIGAVSRRAAEGRSTQKLNDIFDLIKNKESPQRLAPQVYTSLPSIFQEERQRELEALGRE